MVQLFGGSQPADGEVEEVVAVVGAAAEAAAEVASAASVEVVLEVVDQAAVGKTSRKGAKICKVICAFA